ncbi:hypothetical protein DEU56DRAFT_315856 [Suillus clintonianus]|uniref:uncharacterized protein n=1 Tax=Suillus clintonianus TaxID=1904413 RepID=UPI001B863388|nr:uncharacterized protein DEU56DRAFT_315856 [Suillus clintonianus]KAG2155627.1 hypothetical protein DEU56DRAFT_315856 [Suillus clintonianus]
MHDRQLSFSSVSTSALLLTSASAHDIAQPARLGSLTDSSDPSEKRPDSQSSGMTVRRISASVRANVGDDDVFTTQHHTRTLRRRSSRLSKWLEELQVDSSTVQQPETSADVEAVGTECNPYLAYPHLSLATVRRSMDDATSMHDYVVVNDGDVQEYIPPEEPVDVMGSHVPSALADTASTSHRSTIWLNTPPSRHQFRLLVRSPSPAASSASRSPSRLSMFQRSSRATSNSEASNPQDHSRSSSLHTSHPVADARSEERCTHSSPSSWRWRPSVLGHFVSLSDGDTRSSTRDSPGSSSRPSMSSTTTSSSYATPSTNVISEDGASHIPPSMPQKSHFFGSLRSRSQKAVNSSLSLFATDTSSSFPTSFSLPASEPQLSQPPGFPSSLARKSSTIRLPFSPKSKALDSNVPNIFVEAPAATRPRIVYTGKSHAPRVSLSSIAGQSRSTKKKLVIGGIAPNDVKRLEAVQDWCQSFGEVDQITRMPNGDLHVNFHKAEVADTVCRVRAKVYIARVGSVHLSWYSGNKRP